MNSWILSLIPTQNAIEPKNKKGVRRKDALEITKNVLINQ